MTIYIVDEDAIQLEPFKVELELRDYNVKFLKDADEAYNVLTELPDDEVTLAIIDVMLSVNVDSKVSQFNRIETNDFLETGLILTRKLSNKKPNIFPKKALLFSNATNPELVTSIRNNAEKYKIPYLDKSDYQSPLAFGDRVEDILTGLRG